MTPEEIKGIAIESGLCRVNGFSETVRTEYSTIDHVLAFAKAIAEAARAAAIKECIKIAKNDGSAAGDAIAEDIRALLNTGEKT